jgi:hypothetical protein
MGLVHVLFHDDKIRREIIGKLGAFNSRDLEQKDRKNPPRALWNTQPTNLTRKCEEALYG